MASVRNIAFMNSFINDVRQTQKNAADLTAKKAERRYKNELFQFKKKKFEAEISADEMEGRKTSAEAERMRGEFKAFEGFLKGKDKLNETMQNAAGDQIMGKQKQQLGIMRQIQSMTFRETAGGAATLTRTLKAPTTPKPTERIADQKQGLMESFARGESSVKDLALGGLDDDEITGLLKAKQLGAARFDPETGARLSADVSGGQPVSDVQRVSRETEVVEGSGRVVDPLITDLDPVTGQPKDVINIAAKKEIDEQALKVKQGAKIQLGRLVSRNNLGLLAGVVNDFAKVYVGGFKEGGIGGKIQRTIGEFATGEEGFGDAPSFLGGFEVGSKFPETGKFPGKRQEIILKMMPMLTQQVTKAEGSIRLIQGVLDALGQTIPSANTGKRVARGQLAETLKTFFRFARSAEVAGLDFDKLFGDRVNEVSVDEIKGWVLAVNVISSRINITGEELEAFDNMIDTSLAPFNEIIDVEKGREKTPAQLALDKLNKELEELGDF